jgi:hypothetical protein
MLETKKNKQHCQRKLTMLNAQLEEVLAHANTRMHLTAFLVIFKVEAFNFFCC